MKTITKFFTLLLVSLVFASCGDKNDGPAPVLKSKTIDYVYSATIKGTKGVLGGYSLPTLKLQQILGDTIPVKNFIRAEFTPIRSYLMVDGLKNMSPQPRLNALTITSGKNQPLVMGNVAVEAAPDVNFLSDTQLQNDLLVNWIKSVYVDLIGGQKQSDMKISFEPSEDIKESDNVTFKVVIAATYYYNVYPTN